MYEILRGFKLIDAIMAMGLALVAVGIGLNVKTKFEQPKLEFIKAKTSPTVAQVDIKVVFDISGEVIKPGVYQLSGGSRISEALAVAGGLSAAADREWVELNINRAKRINDGEKIYIPRKNVGQPQGLPVQTPVGAGFIPAQILGGQIININRANIDELDRLEGIGPALAQRIIDYRDKNGGFKDINEIKLVSGIGDKLFENIKDKIGL